MGTLESIDVVVIAPELRAFAEATRDVEDFGSERNRRAYDTAARALARRVVAASGYELPVTAEGEAAE